MLRYNLRSSTPCKNDKRINEQITRNGSITKSISKSINKSVTKSTTKQVKRKILPPSPVKINLNIYQRYKHVLSNTVKSELVYRENEIKKIDNFLQIHLKNKTSSSIYISGPPGTGKTACVDHVLDSIENKFKFRKLYLNGMKFLNPNSFYKTIYHYLTGQESQSKDLIELIIKELSKPKAQQLILVLDEIDILDTNHQETLNTIFSLPQQKSTKIIIVGIANTIDLTNKKLTRVNSLQIDAIEKISFQPYDENKIAGILKHRLSELTKEQPLFQDAAIEMCARKIACKIGDIRTALEIMRRSIELVEHEMRNKILKENLNGEEQFKMVNITHIIKIVNQVFGTKVEEANQDDYGFPIQQKITFSIILLLSSEGVKDLNLGRCYDRFRKISKDRSWDIEINSTNTFLEMCELLESKGFITIQKSKDIRLTKLSLSMAEDEAKDMIKNHHLCNSILN